MTEPTGAAPAQHRAEEDAVQAAYTAFIRHTQECTGCRTGGMDCDAAAGLRQTWRDARRAVTA